MNDETGIFWYGTPTAFALGVLAMTTGKLIPDSPPCQSPGQTGCGYGVDEALLLLAILILLCSLIQFAAHYGSDDS